MPRWNNEPLKNHPARLAALSEGLQTWTAPPCSRCGGTIRRTKGEAPCLPCSRERAREHNKTARARNPESFLRSERVWRAANPEIQSSKHARSMAADAQRVRGLKRAREANRRALMRQYGGAWEWSDVAALEQSQSGLCAYCADPWEHVDHMDHVSRGGSNWPANLQLLCAFHNHSKHNKTDAEYRAFIGWPATGKPQMEMAA